MAGALARAADPQSHLPTRTDLRGEDRREVRPSRTEALNLPMSRLQEALEQIAFTRRYTRERIDSVSQADWFTIPPGGVSHVAWQVGHITMGEYRICLERLR